MEVFVIDNLPPEALAMLQALYSRSPKSVQTHLQKVLEVGAEKFMSTYYVGYGHKSIGDCGTTTIFSENVSLLAAKAIQDSALYNGQESSTRYLDISGQPIVDPCNEPEIMQDWMDFYTKILVELDPVIRDLNPRKPGEPYDTYEKAIKAKVFDVARGFLPAGITSYVSWHTNLRQAHDHLRFLLHHPLEEMQVMGKTILSKLREKYESSFLHRTDSFESYLLHTTKALSYQCASEPHTFKVINHLETERISLQELSMLNKRPKGVEIHKYFRRYGDLEFHYLLDFGSYRDVQRHRSVIQPMPLLTTRHGFNKWYLDALSYPLRQEAEELIERQRIKIQRITDPFKAQYYCALGFNVTVEMRASLPAAVYIAELRSQQAVHPTLRTIAQRMAQYIQKLIPQITMYVDYDEDLWTLIRGKQDITEKEVNK